MPDRVEVAEVISEGVSAHPAAVAWKHAGGRRPPAEIRVLKERSKGVRKSAVYWLHDAAPSGAAVIAKMSKRSSSALERLIYGELLPELPVGAPELYGSCDSQDGSHFAWIFLEYVDGERYTPLRPDHRHLIGGWLGELHASAAASEPGALPHRGPDHFIGWLRAGRAAIVSTLSTPELTPDEAEVVRRLERSLDTLEDHWDHVVTISGLLPPTLIHGDLVKKNIVVRSDGGSSDVVAFDWEKAGWGPPAVDLAQVPESHRFSANACLDSYRAALRRHGVDVSEPDLRRTAAVGTVLRCLAGVFWEALSLHPGWVHHVMEYMAFYSRWLDDAMSSAGIGPRDA